MEWNFLGAVRNYNYANINDPYLTPFGLQSDQAANIEDITSEYGMRELGFSKTIHENNRKLFILSHPRRYIHSANVDIQRIGNELTILFNRELKRLYDRGIPVKEARVKALENIKKYKEDKFKKHNIDFPPETIEMAGNRLRLKPV